MAAENEVLLDVTPGGAAIVTLNRPDKHNAFNADIIARLSDIFETLRANTDEVRVVFLRGAGRSFSAGADLEWMKAAADWTHEDNQADALNLARMLKRLHDLPQTTIALVQGAAMGGGAGLMAACDVAVAVKDAKIRFSEVRLGLTPATISPFVVRAIGPRYARALFATGEGFDGEFAHKIGLAQYVVESADELDDMMEYLGKLAFQTAPGAVRDAKALVDMVADREINDDLLRKTAHQIADRRVSDEGREGLAAFLEKRKPYWAD
ncbi:MAG: enoyl-CoA hydratase [Oceanicaulis sp.]|jgi:methylglutaconyl-CoA hydratase|uniref:enoyl-CoA hydratase-related protein n=1 Tax=unclassified Oceanicaulis TaxID=2632123 RepID=UPI000066B0BE|nr:MULTISPECIES: enoyl-CoA hydratase-related protein [unclassified Oceanicaulis]EAP88923.1 enoyl-CoA hydratase/isomerase family protein [Oceanicaulis alexandrii HTCC2633] [Oceanicaulis sp. HTCC2633]MAB69347.1 enoyl-CoA hydratase [Oceanicaulis sp.]MBC38354.1 enoyl-CoA hydratase [Oceanicaulis sp.]MBG36385.1 enoyl-CoA hydratase [Oceanicaulis sp.]HBU61166.1 enoyl-CoA hydratase [Oceanicaulis sp.]|tara:strand:+ start:1950 stop:2747 length:798 start_codon:yes stop_codon:yes gene_type:complete